MTKKYRNMWAQKSPSERKKHTMVRTIDDFLNTKHGYKEEEHQE